jgi:hypothetical protein
MSCWVNGIGVEVLADFDRCVDIARTDEGACQKSRSSLLKPTCT